MIDTRRPCPACGARPGQPCLSPTGKVLREPHAHHLRGHQRTPEWLLKDRTDNRDRYHERKGSSGCD